MPLLPPPLLLPLSLPILPNLPPEILLHILSYLDIPDLLSITRTSHHLRSLSLDPLLHSSRLHRASITLSPFLTSRPSLQELMQQRVYITRTTLVARRLGRELVGIRLNKALGRRKTAEELVGRGVLPRECIGGDGRVKVAPGLIQRKRRVERERVRDFLRGWVVVWGERRGEMVRERWGEEGDNGEGKVEVRRLVRRFAERDGASSSGSGNGQEMPRWGRAREVREEPTRAKVLGLRRFWENLGREGEGS